MRFQPFLYAHLAVGVFVLRGTCIVCGGKSRNQRQLVVGVEIRDDGVDGRRLAAKEVILFEEGA